MFKFCFKEPMMLWDGLKPLVSTGGFQFYIRIYGFERDIIA